MADNISGGGMRNWADMSAGDFYVDGTQLDLLAGIEGDGHGTLDLFDTDTEARPVAPVIRLPWPIASPLFGAEQLVLGAA